MSQEPVITPADLLAAQKRRDAAAKKLTPRHAPPIPRVTAGAIARKTKNPPAELRDLDAAFRGRFFSLFESDEVMARVKALLLSDKDDVALKALRTVLETIPMQRKEQDGEARGQAIQFNVNIPRPEPAPSIDVTSR